MTELAGVAPEGAPELRPMNQVDLEVVVALEREAYPFPWSNGIFRDCLAHGHYCRVLQVGGAILGYGVMSEGAGEAHVLNLCIQPRWRGRGWGRLLMNCLLDEARRRDVATLFLEVRVSNQTAIALYESLGFNEVGRRRDYYPAEQGREDAFVMALALSF